jgi:hypothetical protein
MHFRLIFAGLVFGGAGVMVAVHMVDRSINYQTVPGRVLNVKSTCYLEKRGFKNTEMSEMSPCDVVEATLASDPHYKNFELNRATEADVAYISPADHAEHRGTVYDNSKGTELGFDGKRAGEPLDILAHKSRADKIQKL